jgi:hypothetical protein
MTRDRWFPHHHKSVCVEMIDDMRGYDVRDQVPCRTKELWSLTEEGAG